MACAAEGGVGKKKKKGKGELQLGSNLPAILLEVTGTGDQSQQPEVFSLLLLNPF